MSIILICLLIATLMPIVAKAPLAYAMAQLDGYDNRHPRIQQEQLTGFGARAKAAHENSFEALILFTPGALACVLTNTTGGMAESFAIGFVLARVVYLLSYWFDWHILRSSFWSVGFLASVALLYLAVAGQ